MKGMVFTNLIDFIESQLGLEAADAILEASDLPSGGIYTSVGSYDVAEVAEIVDQTSKHSGLPDSALYAAFGKYLFGQLAKAHPEFVHGLDSPIQLLAQIQDHIHVEVRKLYPDAELPEFDYGHTAEGELEMIYRSKRGLFDLCHGLIEGCFEHFDSKVEIERRPMPNSDIPSMTFIVKELPR